MQYGLVGTGPVGLSIAAHLVKAGERLQVLCIEPDKAAALRSEPLYIDGMLKAQVRLPEIHGKLEDFLARGPDVILLATKSSDGPALLDEIQRLKPAPETVFVSCQNGLDVERYISDRFGEEHALRMVLHFGCSMQSPNHVHVSFARTHIISDRKEVKPAVAHNLASQLSSVGFVTEARTDYRTEVFKKAILNASLSTVCALTGNSMKSTMESPHLRLIVEGIVRESIQIARAEAAEMPDEFFEYAMNYFAMGGTHKPSMLVDVENGKRTENEDHCGRLHYYARKHGVADPVTQTVYFLMRQLEEKRMKRS